MLQPTVFCNFGNVCLVDAVEDLVREGFLQSAGGDFYA
jgi:hypothetical protein